MYNYMRELQRVFFEEPACETLRAEIRTLHQTLKQQLSKNGQTELLSLVDKETELSEHISHASFLAGFRLACGIAAELGQEPPFSFEQEEELRASVIFEKELEHSSNPSA